MNFYVNWAKKESLSRAEVEFLARRLLESNDRYELANLAKRFDLSVDVFADVLASDDHWLLDMLAEVASTSGAEFREGWLKWYATVSPDAQAKVLRRVHYRLNEVEPEFVKGAWEHGSTAARVTLLEGKSQATLEALGEDPIEWLTSAWRQRRTSNDPVSLSYSEGHSIRTLIDGALTPSEACELLIEAGATQWSHRVWQRVVTEGGASDLSDQAARLLEVDAFVSIGGQNLRALVGTPAFEAALALVPRLAQDGHLVPALRSKISKTRGWDCTTLPTTASIRERAAQGVVDEVTFMVLARTEHDDPLREVLAHKSATARRVAGLARAEDLTGVLAEKTPAWRTELMKQVWKLAAKHSVDEGRIELFRALVREHSYEELIEVFEVGSPLVGAYDVITLVDLLGADLAGPVLDQLTLSQLSVAGDVANEAMLERLHSELGASPAALETFHALSVGFQGTFKDLVTTCAELL